MKGFNLICESLFAPKAGNNRDGEKSNTAKQIWEGETLLTLDIIRASDFDGGSMNLDICVVVKFIFLRYFGTRNGRISQKPSKMFEIPNEISLEFKNWKERIPDSRI